MECHFIRRCGAFNRFFNGEKRGLCSIPPISWLDRSITRLTNRLPLQDVKIAMGSTRRFSRQSNAFEIHTNNGWRPHSICLSFNLPVWFPQFPNGTLGRTYSGPQPTNQQTENSSSGRNQTGSVKWSIVAIPTFKTRSHFKERIWVGTKKENTKFPRNWFLWYRLFSLGVL
jgi:hypothetical protein